MRRRKNRRNGVLLTIGDRCDFEAYSKFFRTTKKAVGLEYLNISYSSY